MPPPALPALANPTSVGSARRHLRVVLYTLGRDSQRVARTLAGLHTLAEARGWPVAHEVYDLAPLHVPRRHRMGWRLVENLVTRGELDGLIAPAEREVAWRHGDRIALRAWLLNASVFTVYPRDELGPDVCAQARTGSGEGQE